ncbi:hypothetical protein [Halobaculum litoreum]|uniref:hypothetical protein n=1 Tax=Halobaculum litoreum TaxID=3031998 RepID=UPI0024C39826|nr:hypothetical protein [Halobaculum sp. DT92]
MGHPLGDAVEFQDPRDGCTTRPPLVPRVNPIPILEVDFREVVLATGVPDLLGRVPGEVVDAVDVESRGDHMVPEVVPEEGDLALVHEAEQFVAPFVGIGEVAGQRDRFARGAVFGDRPREFPFT